MGIHNWTQIGKGTYMRTLCQKNKGSVEIKHTPIKMDSRTICLRTKTMEFSFSLVGLFTEQCHLKGHLFKLGLTDDPTVRL
jgi:hypothetical protein